MPVPRSALRGGWEGSSSMSSASAVSHRAAWKCQVEVDIRGVGCLAQRQRAERSCRVVSLRCKEKHCLEHRINILTFGTWTDSKDPFASCLSVAQVLLHVLESPRLGALRNLCQKLRCKLNAGISED